MPRTKKLTAVQPVAGAHKIIGQDDSLQMIRVAVEQNHPVLLIGDTGTGKTSIVKDVAAEHGKEWVRFNLTGETTVDEFVGKYVLINGQTQWQDGVLLQAMKKGHWLICDEINAALPEILFVLHSLLDDDKHVMVANHDGEVVHPHADFRFFATMNPVDEYAGTKELNKAFKSRFGMILIIETPDNLTEAKIIQDRTGVDEANARMIVMVASKIRKLKKDQEIFLTVSTRDLLQWAALGKHMKAAESFVATILNKSDSEEERETIKKAIQGVLEIVQQSVKQGNKQLDPEWFEKQSNNFQRELEQMNKKMREEAGKVREEIRKEEQQRANQVLQERSNQLLKSLGEALTANNATGGSQNQNGQGENGQNGSQNGSPQQGQGNGTGQGQQPSQSGQNGNAMGISGTLLAMQEATNQAMKAAQEAYEASETAGEEANQQMRENQQSKNGQTPEEGEVVTGATFEAGVFDPQ